MRFLLIGLMLAGIAGCADVHGKTGGGPSQVPAEAGGGLGPAGEGSPGNAHNLGGDNSKTLDSAH